MRPMFERKVGAVFLGPFPIRSGATTREEGAERMIFRAPEPSGGS